MHTYNPHGELGGREGWGGRERERFKFKKNASL